MSEHFPAHELHTKMHSRQIRGRVIAVLAWLIVICAWDLASRVEESAADTQPARLASILRPSSNPREIEYEAMHESGSCCRQCCAVGQRMLDR